MEKEMLDLISKNLPAQVGDVLQKRLAEAKKLEEQVYMLQETVRIQTATVIEIQTELDDYRVFDERNKVMNDREKALEYREHAIFLDQALYELKVEKDKTEFCKSVALGLVKNTEYRKEVFGTKPFPIGSTNNNPGWVTQGQESMSEVTKSE